MRIIFTGGGTGGHIYPALAVARTVQKMDPAAAILFLGAAGGMEEKIVPGAGFQLETLPVEGFSRQKLLRGLRTAQLLARSCLQARKTMERFRPDVIFGTGGFASAPALLAALAGRKRVIIHEQNVLPGLTNRFLAPWVDLVCLSFEVSKQHYRKKANLVVTGNPRASEVASLQREEARERLQVERERPLLLVFGGSRGAARINQCMLEFLEEMDEDEKIQVLYITGEMYYDDVVARLEKGRIMEKLGSKLTVKPYEQEMPVALAAADCLVSRAGATTLAEITALGVPAVLVPSPNVVHDHQLVNARSLEQAGAAVVLEEGDLKAGAFRAAVNALLHDPARREEIRARSLALGKPGAAAAIFGLLTGREPGDPGKL